jgi:ADP-heptose:LPS heptosyltransferase
VEGNPSVDQVIVDWKKTGQAKGFRGWWRYVQFLRSLQIDMVFLPYVDMYYAVLMAMAGIPVRVGDARHLTEARWITHTVPIIHQNLAAHESEHITTLIYAVSKSPVIQSNFGLHVDPADSAPIRTLLTELGLRTPGYVVIHPTFRSENRSLSTAQFARVVDEVAHKTGLQAILIGGPGDVALCQSIARLTAIPPLIVAGQTTVGQLKALIQHAAFFIAATSGPMHIASAFKAPIFSVMATKFIKPVRWGPWQTKAINFSQFYRAFRRRR